MRWLLALVAVAATGCSTTTPDVEDSTPLITRAEGSNDSIWSQDVGTLRLEDGCVLFKGQLTAFPHGARLVAGDTALQLGDDDDPVPVDGETLVAVTGSEVPLGEEGAWDHVLPGADLERWDRCRTSVGISEYADWWQVNGVTVAE